MPTMPALPTSRPLGLAALLIAALVVVGAVLFPWPRPPRELPQRPPADDTPIETTYGVGAEASRQWAPIAQLADAIREPIQPSAITPQNQGETTQPKPTLPPLNWRYVGLLTVRKADGTVVPVATMRIDGLQQMIAVGDLLPAPGPHEVEIIEITAERIRYKRGETEGEVPIDDELSLIEQRGMGA